jgi:hypothetical protein
MDDSNTESLSLDDLLNVDLPGNTNINHSEVSSASTVALSYHHTSRTVAYNKFCSIIYILGSSDKREGRTLQSISDSHSLDEVLNADIPESTNNNNSEDYASASMVALYYHHTSPTVDTPC